MSHPSSIFHLKNYFSAGVLVAIAGVISFSLLTRNLSVYDYGILGLVTSSLTLAIPIGKLGAQHSIFWLYARSRSNDSEFSTENLKNTVLLLFLALAFATWIMWASAIFFIFPDYIPYNYDVELLFVASGVLFIKLLGSGVTNFLNAQQRSSTVGFLQVFNRYLYIALLISFLFINSFDPSTIFLCLLITEFICIATLLYILPIDITSIFCHFSSQLVRKMVAYGVPLMILESSMLFLRHGDRFVIGHHLGTDVLGMYSASYALVAYLEVIFLVAIVNTIRPIYSHLWEEKGHARTKQYLSRGFYLYLLLGFPLIALASLILPYILLFLAGVEYYPGTKIIPLTALSFLLQGCVHFLGAGLYLTGNTRVLMVWGVGAVCLNLILNIMIVPSYGIIGAAIVNVLSFSLYIFGVTLESQRYLKLEIQYGKVAGIGLCSCVTFFWCERFSTGGEIYEIPVKVLMAIFLISLGIFLIEYKTIRSKIIQFFGK